MSERNVDTAELNKFDALAQKWWDTESEFKPLHAIKPLRVGYIADKVNLSGKRALDVGCGEPLLLASMLLRLLSGWRFSIDMSPTSGRNTN